MKTLNEFTVQLLESCKIDTGALDDNDPEFIPYIADEIKKYIQEVIKLDRINIAEHTKVRKGGSYKTNEGYLTSNSIYVDKESIINAPQIELL